MRQALLEQQLRGVHDVVEVELEDAGVELEIVIEQWEYGPVLRDVGLRLREAVHFDVEVEVFAGLDSFEDLLEVYFQLLVLNVVELGFVLQIRLLVLPHQAVKYLDLLVARVHLVEVVDPENDDAVKLWLLLLLRVG